MPVFKYDDIKLGPVVMDGAEKTTKANVIGSTEGWKDHTLRVFHIEPGGCTPHHSHDWEHINYIIKGKGVLVIGDEEFELSERDFALVPPNAMHQFSNPYQQDFEFICIVPIRA